MLLPFIFAALALAARVTANYNVKPFKIQIPSEEVSRMVDLARLTRLTSGEEFEGANNVSLGITRETLGDLRHKWIDTYDWRKEEIKLNQYHHYTAEIENVTIHFIHEKSEDPTAIPIIMSHGWPGSFLEWLPTVPLLTQSIENRHGRNVTYSVVIPSLPGFGFSTLPSNTWTPNDTARVFNTLMVEVLGYEKYTAFGSDWGAKINHIMYTKYTANVKAAHFSFIPFFPLTADELATENITLSAFEQEGLQRWTNFTTSGMGYFIEHNTRPNTIGQALLDNPVGQLAWIGEKFFEWTDPDRSAPSTFNDETILTSVSLYFLTRTFLSSVWIYHVGALGTGPAAYNIERPVAPMGFSAFRYNPGAWPEAMIAKVGNLTVYREHSRGGHFPGIDNPVDLVADIRELAEYWEY